MTEQILEQHISSQRAEGSLLGNYAISSHLRLLGYPETSIRSMNRCGEETGFFMMSDCGCGGRTFPLKYDCNLRVCVRCAKKRKNRLRRKFYPYLKDIPKDRNREHLYFLTISPKNYYNFKHGLTHILTSFRKFLRNKYIKERIKGGLYVIETKFSVEKGWNIHLHCIIFGRRLDNRIRGKCFDCSQNLLKFDYYKKRYYCANKKCNSLNVRHNSDSKIVGIWKQSSDREVNIHVSRQHTSLYSLNYMLKYITSNKEDFETVEQCSEYISGIYKRKLINVFGTFFRKDYKLDPMICQVCGQEVFYELDFTVSIVVSGYYDNPPPPHPQASLEVYLALDSTQS